MSLFAAITDAAASRQRYSLRNTPDLSVRRLKKEFSDFAFNDNSASGLQLQKQPSGMAELSPIVKKTMRKTIKTMMYAADSSLFAAKAMLLRVKTMIFRGRRTGFFTKTMGLIRRILVFDGKCILFIA
jgi:hypothetical protein